MHEDFLTRIKSSYNLFTKAEKKVADYVLSNPERVLFMSISDLADSCNVGDTSVFRFCKTMNVKGYQEFKMMLSFSIRADKDIVPTDTNRIISIEDSLQELSRKVLNDNIAAIKETYSLLDYKKIEQAIDYMQKARRIVFFGCGTSLLTAMKACNKFGRIEPKVYCNQDLYMQMMMANTMSEDDLAIIFSYSGSTKDTVDIARSIYYSNSRSIIITRFAKSSLTEYGDIVLLSGANEGPLQAGATSSEISQMFLVDVLYSEYFRKNYNKCQRNYDNTKRAISHRHES